MSSSISILESSDPEVTLQQCLEAFSQSSKDSDAFALTFSLRQDYLPEAPLIRLFAFFAFRRESDGTPRVGFSLAEASQGLRDKAGRIEADWHSIQRWCHEQELVWLELGKPITLEPVHIPKPWGQEIWYTGIEERGQSRVVDERGCSVPLPWLLAVCPQALTGSKTSQLILLKVLDPLPEPVFGDLYFEMHEEKREVYVVTHVDKKAWPDGQGGIRFGFNQEKRGQLGSDAEFKRQYLKAVRAYRELRVQIDELLDQHRQKQGIALNEPVAPETLKSWLAELPEHLLAREAELRATMETFIHVDPLRVGDVVKVPCYTPHSLLHGVRTVEFQTPVYERKILSFAQKVLTQTHWDTEEAMELVTIDAPERASLPLIAEEAAYRIEEVVDFEDFRVERITLSQGASFGVVAGREYALLMSVTEGALLNQRPMKAEQAVFLPAGEQAQRITSNEQEAVLLLARPK